MTLICQKKSVPIRKKKNFGDANSRTEVAKATADLSQ